MTEQEQAAEELAARFWSFFVGTTARYPPTRTEFLEWAKERLLEYAAAGVRRGVRVRRSRRDRQHVAGDEIFLPSLLLGRIEP